MLLQILKLVHVFRKEKSLFQAFIENARLALLGIPKGSVIHDWVP